MAILLPLILFANIEVRPCDQIRGTEYLNEQERLFYHAECMKRQVITEGMPQVLIDIRWCESKDDYSATNGIHRGAYQFDQQTWESVGGVGDPSLATPEEQDKRAVMLYNQRGTKPWQGCL